MCVSKAAHAIALKKLRKLTREIGTMRDAKAADDARRDGERRRRPISAADTSAAAPRAPPADADADELAAMREALADARAAVRDAHVARDEALAQSADMRAALEVARVELRRRAEGGAEGGAEPARAPPPSAGGPVLVLAPDAPDATVRAVFDAADRDRSGAIDKAEFIALLTQLGILSGADAEEDEGLLDDELYTADEDGNETIDQGEFLRWYRERGEQLGRRRVQLDETGRIVEATLLDG